MSWGGRRPWWESLQGSCPQNRRHRQPRPPLLRRRPPTAHDAHQEPGGHARARNAGRRKPGGHDLKAGGGRADHHRGAGKEGRQALATLALTLHDTGRVVGRAGFGKAAVGYGHVVVDVSRRLQRLRENALETRLVRLHLHEVPAGGAAGPEVDPSAGHLRARNEAGGEARVLRGDQAGDGLVLDRQGLGGGQPGSEAETHERQDSCRLSPAERTGRSTSPSVIGGRMSKSRAIWNRGS